MKKIYYLNDCTDCHVGSLYVTLGFKKALEMYDVYGIKTPPIPRRTYIKSELEKCDTVIVNGEGVIHHTATYTNGGTELLTQIDSFQKMGKVVLLMNCVFQSVDPKWANVLSRCKYITVREPWSKQHLMAIGVKTDIDVCLDMTAYHDYDVVQSKTKGIAVGNVHPEFKGYREFYPLKEKFDNLSMPKNKFMPYLRSLSTYKVFITGQHHGMYACIFAKTPFIVYPSNTYKIESFLDWTGADINVHYDFNDIMGKIHECETSGSYDYIFNEWFPEKVAELKLIMNEKIHDLIV